MSTSAHYELPPLTQATSFSQQGSAEASSADVKLFDEQDGGNIEIVNGMVTMSAGLETAAYLALFGGNEDDSGLQGDDAKQWWGNLSESDPAKQYRSKTQNLLRALPAISSNLRRLEDAAKDDLSSVFSALASAISVDASIPALNQVKLTVSIVIDDVLYEFAFTQPWGKT